MLSFKKEYIFDFAAESFLGGICMDSLIRFLKDKSNLTDDEIDKYIEILIQKIKKQGQQNIFNNT